MTSFRNRAAVAAALLLVAGAAAAQDGGGQGGDQGGGQPSINLPIVGDVPLPGFLSFLASNDGGGGQGGQGGQGQGSSQPPAVVFVEAEPEPAGQTYRFIGRTTPIERVEIVPRVAGYIEEVAFQGGEFVNEGDVLFRIDQATYEAALASAEAQLNGAQAQLEEAQRQLERDQELANSGTIPQARLQETQAAFQSAQATVQQAEAAVREAELNLEFTTVTAAIDGQMSAPLQTAGNYVSAQGNALAELVQLDPIWGVFPVSEAQLARSRRLGFGQVDVAPVNGGQGGSNGAPQSSGTGGQSATPASTGGSSGGSTGDAGGGSPPGDQPSSRDALEPGDYRLRLELTDDVVYDPEGEFAFVGNSVNPNTGTVEIRIRFPNPDGVLLANQNVTLLVSEADPPVYPVIPQAAIQLDRSGRSVWVIGEDDTVSQQQVELQYISGAGTAAVTSGLDGGERVVVRGARTLQDGMSVNPTAATEAEIPGIGGGSGGPGSGGQ